MQEMRMRTISEKYITNTIEGIWVGVKNYLRIFRGVKNISTYTWLFLN